MGYFERLSKENRVLEAFEERIQEANRRDQRIMDVCCVLGPEGFGWNLPHACGEKGERKHRAIPSGYTEPGFPLEIRYVDRCIAQQA